MMKNILTALLFTFISVVMLAQAPQSIPYQAVVRSANGSPLLNTAMTITFKIHNLTTDGVLVYQESHSTTSNAQGLVNLQVGQGQNVSGDFSNINWNNGAKFVQVQMNDGSGNVEMGTQQLMSVPYALHSKFAENGISGISVNGDTLYLTNGDFLIIPGVSIMNSAQSNSGMALLPGNDTCDDQIISVSGCAGEDTLLYNNTNYTLVEIGGQCWFADNLATDKYRNGDLIPTGLSNSSWQNTTSGSYSYFRDSLVYDMNYGKLYNWYAVADNRGLCPTGWHVPSDCEWMYLEKSLGMSPWTIETVGANRGTNQAIKMKSNLGWMAPYSNGTNESGFSADGCGFKDYGGNYLGFGSYSYFWSTSINDGGSPYTRYLTAPSNGISRYTGFKNSGYGVRCLKD